MKTAPWWTDAYRWHTLLHRCSLDSHELYCTVWCHGCRSRHHTGTHQADMSAGLRGWGWGWGWGGKTDTNAHKVTPGNTLLNLRIFDLSIACKVHSQWGQRHQMHTRFPHVFQSARNNSHAARACTETGPGGNKRGGRCFIQCQWKIPHTLIYRVSWPLCSGAGQVYLTHSSF